MRGREGSRWDDPRHFSTRRAFRDWLRESHDRVDELWVGFYRKGEGQGMTYAEAVDEALCWGWIDGVRKKVDDVRYTNRFTARRPKSRWSEANLRRYAELDAEGLVAAPGRAAYGRRDPDRRPPRRVRDYPSTFEGETADHFRTDHPEAWRFFHAQPAGYRRACVMWVTSAKRPATRERRLAKLIDFSAAGERLPEAEGRPTREKP